MKIQSLISSILLLFLASGCSVPRPKPVAGAPSCNLPRTILTATETGDRASAIFSNPLSVVLGKMAADRAAQLQLFESNLSKTERREAGMMSIPNAELSRLLEPIRIRHLVLAGVSTVRSARGFSTGLLHTLPMTS